MSKDIAGLRIVLNQMNVTPGRPDINARYIIGEVQAAVARGVDIIIFPEMAVPGYFIGDKLENESFVKDIARWNREICLASKNITVIFGTVVASSGKKGEDGRMRVLNAAMVATNGSYEGYTVKTLQPNYRFFNDDKHMYSMRKIMAEAGKSLQECLQLFTLQTRIGAINVGVILCEDMWHADYPLNPTKVLVDKGADVICNISASPWGWQKNRKRHSVVRNLLQESPVPFVYVNNTGTQNTGKNVLVFDGSSTVYNQHGAIIHEVPAYTAGSHDFTFAENLPPVAEQISNDTAELYAAMRCVVAEYFAAMPLYRRRVVLGVSGGIDSAVVAALLVDVLGPLRVFGVNMPYTYTSQKTKDLAEVICRNLAMSYEVQPINEIVESVCAVSSRVIPGSVAHQNVLARARMNVLATKAQAEGCVYTSNCNKVEMAFGYGTLYADLAGYLGILTDLIKREVRQIAAYLNEVVFGREVIPQECIDQKPTAELAANQFDPFDYGTVDRRGYHDELVRSFVEFSRDPEWVLAEYMAGTLEQSLLLEPGTLNRLFPNPIHFIRDLEKHWSMFNFSYIKRIQTLPVPVMSKRAFGRDFEEAVMPTHYTQRYKELRGVLMERSPKIPTVAIYGGSFNPPGNHHRQILLTLSEQFDKVIVVPCGVRPDKDPGSFVSATHRERMVELAFAGIGNVEIDAFDIDSDVFMPTYKLDERYKSLMPNYDVFHVVGGDLVVNGNMGRAAIQASWLRGWELWESLNFAVLDHPAYPVDVIDLPPRTTKVVCPAIVGRATDIRNLLKRGEQVNGLLTTEVGDYIRQHHLYETV